MYAGRTKRWRTGGWEHLGTRNAVFRVAYRRFMASRSVDQSLQYEDSNYRNKGKPKYLFLCKLTRCKKLRTYQTLLLIAE